MESSDESPGESSGDQLNLNMNQRRKRCHPDSNVQACKYQKTEQGCSKTSANEDNADGTAFSCSIDRHGESTIADLPAAVLVKIFRYLSLHDLLLLAGLVCKQWRDLTQDPDLWRVIDLNMLKWQSKVDDVVLSRLCSYSRNVTSLCAPNLNKMVTGKGIQAVLQKCSNLKHLVFAGSMDLDNTAFDAIAEYCHQLVFLDLSCCYNMNDSALAKMAQHCKLLEKVLLSQCHSVTDGGIRNLAQGCPRLKVLALKHNNEVTDKTVEAICDNCTGLEELLLTRCDVTSACLSSIAKLSELRVLELASFGPVSASEIRQVVKNCPKLSRLNLSLCQSVDDGCVDVIVRHSKQLSSLFLVSCSITDKSLLKLGKFCKTLERLDIGWCQAVTDDGVFELCRSCPKLKYLGLMRCDAISNEAALTLSNKYPQCTISTVSLDCYRLLQKAGKASNT